jgi:NAD(P)-dependent dehydrogenase (short-subunit alcohol dehydrogenase family)
MSNTIFITGCNGNLATYLVNELSIRGFRIIGCDVDSSSSDRTKNSISLGINEYFQCDISNTEEINLLSTKLNKLEIYPNILINNAAIDFVPTTESDKTGLDFSDFDKIINVNVKAPLFLSKIFIEYWRTNKIYGNILNISSIYSLVSPDPNNYQNGFIKNVLYGITKSALNSITIQLSVLTAKDNIRVNAILFAGIESNSQHPEFVKKYISKIPIGRLMRKNEILEPILFLISNGNSYTTGTLLKVDGGYTCI